MISPQRLEQDLPAVLDGLYVTGTPDYRDDLFRATARTRQRPAWSFLTRLIPMDVASRRVPVSPIPWRALGFVLLLLALLAVAVALAVGSRPRLPSPFGPARNGPIAYAIGGEVLVQDAPGKPGRTLIGGTTDADNHSPTFSPDGTRLLFVQTVDHKDHLMVADADGSHIRQVLDHPVDADAFACWAPDSRAIAVTTRVDGKRGLFMVHVDGSPPTKIDLGEIIPTDVAFRPPLGAQLLVRGESPSTKQDLYLINADGSGIHAFGLQSNLELGYEWDNSGPAWSPAGDRIAYNVVEHAATGPGTFRLHVVEADGSHDHAVPEPNDAATQEAWPAWSPDGRSILVHRWTWNPDGEGWLAVMPADGSAAAHDIGKRWPGGEDTGLVKTWSPDGTRILVRVDNSQEVFSIDPISDLTDQLPWTGSDLPDYMRLAP